MKQKRTSDQLIKFASLQEMKEYGNQNQMVLVSYKTIVYDLSEFLFYHSGGFEKIKEYDGCCLDSVLFNSDIHKHSAQIIPHLEQYKFGIIDKKLECSMGSQNKALAFSPCFSQFSVGKTRKMLLENLKNDKTGSKLDQQFSTKDIGFEQVNSQTLIEDSQEEGIQQVPSIAPNLMTRIQKGIND